MMQVRELKKQEKIYLLVVVGICYILGVIGFFTGGKEDNIAIDMLQDVFTAFPILGALLTSKLLSDKNQIWFSIKVWKNWKLWIICAFIPSILIGFGAAIYFFLFPQSYTGAFSYGELVNLTGATSKGILVIENPITFWLVVVIISAVFIPVQLLELGEEIGWRGYLLPKQIAMYGTPKAVLLNGFWWGMAHMPLIYFGFNYSTKNWLSPWSNMILMMCLCIVMGIILSYVTVKSKNCMYASIIHGVVNIAGEIPVFLSVSGENGLLGPNPTGLIGMSGLIVSAIILFIFLLKKEKQANLNKQES